MKIAQSQAIIQNGWEWRDRKDNGDAEAECKFDPSFVEGEKDSPDARLGGARTIEAIRIRSSHVHGYIFSYIPPHCPSMLRIPSLRQIPIFIKNKEDRPAGTLVPYVT